MVQNSQKEIGWNFPSNNQGNIDGFNNSGIETYRGSPTSALAREIIQNSLDAKQNSIDEPVIVKFSFHDYPTNKFPNLEKFKKTLLACQEFWEHNEKAQNFFKEAYNIMQNETLPVLKISDYNTTGLTGSKKDFFTRWHRLIKSSGASNKGYGAGGSFGIGKFAPFACSDLRTVFYLTKDKNDIKAFQGVAQLVSHKKSEEVVTQGKGFFGNTNGNKPLHDLSILDSYFDRQRSGTDIFIFGFKYSENWKNKITKSILENFLVSIYYKELIVEIEDEKINADNLGDYIEKYIIDSSNKKKYYSDKYFKVLENDEHYYFKEDNFEEMGELELYLLPKKDFPKRVAMVRGTGMKIFDKGHFRTPMKFAGVFLANGLDLNEFLREIEPPKHNSWEEERHSNPSYAEGIKSKIYSWINDKVNSISVDEDAEKVDIEGMSQFLPDEFDELPLDEEELTESEESEDEIEEPQSVKVRATTTQTSTGIKGGPNSQEEDGTIYESEGNAGGSGGGHQEESEVDDEGSGGNTPNDNGENSTFSNKPINLKRSRIICLNKDEGLYLAAVEPSKDGKGYLKFNLVGEDMTESAVVKEARIKGVNNGRINVKNNGKVGPVKMQKGEMTELIIRLAENMRFAMEVDAYEN